MIERLNFENKNVLKKIIYTMKKLYSILASIVFLLVLSIQSKAHFGSKGPFGGSVSCMVTAGDTVYVGTKEGGVYESTSALLVGWRARPVGLKSGKITAVAHTGKYLYAATADSGIFIFNGYVGSDRYWNKVNTGLTNLNVTSLIAINATTLLAGTTNGLFLTTNGGSSWTATTGNLNHGSITAISKAGSRIFVTTAHGGVYATDNLGTNWIDFNDVNTDLLNGTSLLSVNASADELMILNQNGLFATSSIATTSTPVYTSALANLPAGVAINSISNDGASWYLTTDKGVFVSSVSTISWSTMNTGLTTEDVNAIVPFKTGLVCATQVEGIFKTQLPFVSWSSMNVNFNNLNTRAMLADGLLLLAAATEKGIYVSKDLGANYVASNTGLDDSLTVTDLIMASTYLLASTENGVYISADTGKHWSRASAGLINVHTKKLFYSNSKIYLFDSNGDIFSSSLDPVNWVKLTGNLPMGVKPSSLAFYKNTLLLGTNGHGIFIKSISESLWTSMNAGLSNWNVTSVAVLNTKIYAGTDGAGVFVSDSAKASVHWTATSPTSIAHTTMLHLDGTRIQAMGTFAGYVWASYKGGLLASSNQGATWIAGGNQFNLPSFTDVAKINFVATRVFVSTQNNGLYSNALSEIPVVNPSIGTGILNSMQINSSAVLVSPNPNQGVFKLDTKNVSGQISEISIYDFAGTLKDRFSSEQDLYHVNYAQGVYVVQIKTSEDILYTQKMIVQ